MEESLCSGWQWSRFSSSARCFTTIKLTFRHDNSLKKKTPVVFWLLRVQLSPAGVDGWRLMLVSAARASMSQGSTRACVLRANHSGPAASRATRTANRRASLPPKQPAHFEWNTHHVTRLERLCQKVEGEPSGCHYGEKCLIWALI